MRKVDHYDPWARRVDALRDLPLANTCELSAAAKLHHAAPSLGLGGVADVTGIHFETHPGWNEKQKAILSRALEEVDLFGTGEGTKKLEAPRLVVPGQDFGASRLIGGWPPKAEWRRRLL